MNRYPIRWHLVLAALLFAFEIYLGIGIVGTTIGFAVALVAFLRALKWKDQRQHLFRVAAIYGMLCLGTFFVIAWNSELAQRRAQPLITAVERFHSDRGHYPETLNELVPAYLPAIPRGGFTSISSQYRYDPKRPQIYFAAMFHGVFFYDFPTKRWLANE